MSSTDSWLLFLNWPFSCWELGRLSFHNFLAARPPEWQALEAGLLVPHMYPTLFQDSWKGNHQIHGEMLIRFFCCGICLDKWISYSISYDLLSLLRDGSSRWSNPTRSPERLHLIISDSVQGLGRDGLQLPPIDVPAWSLEPHELGLFTTFPQSKCATNVFLSEVTPPVHSFAVISLPLQLTTKSGTLRVIWETLLRKWAKGQQVAISAEYSCNFETRFKKAPKPSSFSKGNACFVCCCSWMDIPPRWWTFYAWPLLGRELMGRHCKGC